MPSNYWLKLYHEILDDPKMGRLDDHTFRRVIEVFLLAGDLGTERGELPSVEDMAWRLRCSPDALETDIKAIVLAGFLTRDDDGELYVTQWATRQAASPAVERQQRHRERSRKAQYYGHEPRHEPVTTRDIELEVESDTDTEVEAEPERGNGGDPAIIADRARVFRAIASAGIIVNSFQSEHYSALLEDFDIETISLAFAEAKKQGKPPRWQYLRAILERCKEYNCQPGEWPDEPNKAEPEGEPYARDGPLETFWGVDNNGNRIELTR